MRISGQKNLETILKNPTKPFQEFVFPARKNRNNFYEHNDFGMGERKILDILSQTQQDEIQSNGFAVMFCKDRDISTFFQADKFDKFWLDDEKSNFRNEKVFYLNTETIRKIATAKALKSLANYAVKKSSSKSVPKTQSCMIFDVDSQGCLALRGAVTLKFSETKNFATVFVDTKLCKKHEHSKTNKNELSR